MEIELISSHVSDEGPHTDGHLTVRKFKFSLREEKPATGCTPIEAELTVKFRTVPGQIVPTDMLSSCKAVLSMPAVTPIKILRNVDLYSHKTPGRPNGSESIVRLRKNENFSLTEPARKISKNSIIYEVLSTGG
jgi:hypothetical protein